MRTLSAIACCLLALFPVLSVRTAAQGADTSDASRISQEDFKKLVAANTAIIVDTRQPDAFQRGHIPGAILLPLEGQPTWPAAFETTVTTLLKTTKAVVTYCA
jgi:rhodanese-related sulfurtransferase